MAEVNIIKIDGKPLEKLIEVISKGIGTLYKPRSMRREADAKAYEISILERAKAQAQAEGREIDAINLERLEDRLCAKELRRQKNIDQVAELASEILEHDEKVSNDPIREDWAVRFFNIIQDVSDEEMQALWGRVLAGEITRPQSYSLRTLEILKNLNRDEAITFSKAAQLGLYCDDVAMILHPKDELSKSKVPITIGELLLLQEVGLIVGVGQDLEYRFEDVSSKITYGQKVITVTRDNEVDPPAIPIVCLTTAGVELSRLIDKKVNSEYVDIILQRLKRDNTDVSIAALTEDEGVSTV